MFDPEKKEDVHVSNATISFFIYPSEGPVTCSPCLAIIRCVKFHIYALLKHERDSRVSIALNLKSCKRGKKRQHCTPLSVPHTSFVPLLLCHVI